MTRAQGKHREFSLNQSVATLQKVGTLPVSWQVSTPPPPQCEQTDTCENSTFPIPSECGR